MLFNQKNGIKGGHNRVNFEKELFSKGGIIKSEQPTGVDGITRITYGIPKKDGSGKIMRDTAGNIMYKTPGSNPKTVYDPAKFTDKQMLDMSVNAAAKEYLKAKQNQKNQYSSEWGGVKFHVYLNPRTGEITNVHPE